MAKIPGQICARTLSTILGAAHQLLTLSTRQPSKAGAARVSFQFLVSAIMVQPAAPQEYRARIQSHSVSGPSPATYELRLLGNNGFTSLAVSNSVQVVSGQTFGRAMIRR